MIRPCRNGTIKAAQRFVGRMRQRSSTGNLDVLGIEGVQGEGEQRQDAGGGGSVFGEDRVETKARSWIRIEGQSRRFCRAADHFGNFCR
jgi:hypothetical protein